MWNTYPNHLKWIAWVRDMCPDPGYSFQVIRISISHTYCLSGQGLFFPTSSDLSTFSVQIGSLLHNYLTWSVIWKAHLVLLFQAVILVVWGKNYLTLDVALKWKIVKVSGFLESWFNMHVQSSISNKYFKYLSASSEKNSPGQKHVAGLRKIVFCRFG